MQRLFACPHCGQPLPTKRLGVRLTPLKARIFDAVQRAGPDGVGGHDLMVALGMRRRGLVGMRSHIWQINDSIEETGYRIISRMHAYRLVQECAQPNQGENHADQRSGSGGG